MEESYEEYFRQANEQREDIKKTLGRFWKKKPKEVDSLFHNAHDEAFEVIDCMKCANCCKTTSPIFRDVDIRRISKKMKMSAGDFEKKYLRKDEEDDWVLQSSPCPFLYGDNSCGIYDYRPLACEEYPHTNRKKMSQVIDLTIANMDVCPAVAKITTDINRKINPK